MLKKIFIASLCFALTGASAFAAFSAKTFAAAKKRNPKDGIIAYFYGPDWDVRSTKMLKTLWESSEIKSACGDSAMLPVPVYQEPDEKQKKNAKTIREGMKVPHIFSYPAIVMFTEEGEKYYILQGDEIFEETPKVAETIKAKLKLFRERKAILKKAERAKGLEKARLYGEALLDGIEPPEDALKVIKANDPKGETPYARRLEFDVFKLLTDQTYKDPDKPDKVLIAPDAAVALVTKLAIADETTYLPWQRQELLAACAAYLRRLDKNDARIKTLHKKILEIDPESVWADFVEDSEARWLSSDKKKKDKKEKRRRKK